MIPRAALTLADVGTSAGSALGVPGMVDRLGLGRARHVVVCLVDGLGWQALRDHADLAPNLSAMAGAPIQAAFPTTTPVGLGSLGTGLLAGQHGLVGAAFEYPETGEVLIPLQWGHHPTPVAVQPEPTVFERVERHGVRVTTLSPGAYANSGLTRAVLRGATYVGCEDVASRVSNLTMIVTSPDPSFTYVYWPELDRVGHESGVDSDAWRGALARVDGLVEQLCSVLVPGTVLVVTADHGMVDCPPNRRVVLEDHAELARGVRRWAGEPRVRHVYTDLGALPDVHQAWADVLSDHADVMTRAQVIDTGLMGPVDEELEARIGDLVVLARANVALASSVDRTVSSLLGQHGGLTAEELLIPALIARV